VRILLEKQFTMPKSAARGGVRAFRHIAKRACNITLQALDLLRILVGSASFELAPPAV
jgi:hypothetical protein